METILAITRNTDCAIKLIACKTRREAIKHMKYIYEKLCRETNYDMHNTFCDEESGYAQIVSGLEQTELRIGMLSAV